MQAVLAEALATPGVWVLVGAAVLAGLVRGFSGFGTALVFLPLAGTQLAPLWAILALIVMDMFGPLPQVPRAAREGHVRDVFRLILAVCVTLPIGLAVLVWMERDVFRWIVCGLTFGMLTALVSGWRWQRPVGPGQVYGIGAAAGLLGGVAGLPGPPVILFYMARPLGVEVVRATLMLFLLLFDVVFFGVLGVQGRLEAVPVVIGLLLVVPYLLALSLGAWMFAPDRVGLYRRVAYVIIAGSALAGLPVWG